MYFQYFLKIRDIKNISVTWIRFIDLSVQTILFIAVPVTLIYFRGKPSWLSELLGIQFVMGVWQMSGSFLSVVFKGPAFRRKLRHFTISSAYLLLFVLLLTTRTTSGYQAGYLSEIVTGICCFGPPWALAIYYYITTWQLVFPRQKKLSNFLPHINY